MTSDEVSSFLQQYDRDVASMVGELRRIVASLLPGVTEQLDLPAKMIAYCYGRRYIDMVCTIHPSKKGVKLGFYKGAELPDPDGLLQGTGKLSRYVIVDSGRLHSVALRQLLEHALTSYRERMKEKGEL
jgi:hypothetical protein